MHPAFRDDEDDFYSLDKEANLNLGDLLGAKITLEKKPADAEMQRIAILTTIVNTLEQGIARRSLLKWDYAIDLEFYDEVFEDALMKIAELYFGVDTLKWIEFYVHERIDEETGQLNYLEDQNGVQYFLSNPRDLWNIIKHTSDQNNPKKSRTRKKKEK